MSAKGYFGVHTKSKKSECIKQEQNSAEQVQSAPQTTESSEKTEDDKTIIEYAKAENNDSDECPF